MPRQACLLSCALLVGAAFAFDVMTPLGIASGVAYVLPVSIALLSPNRTDLVAISAVCVFLTGAGVIASPPGASWETFMLNRTLTIMMIGVLSTIGFLIGARRLVVGDLRHAIGIPFIAERWFYAFFESAPNGKIIVNSDGEIIYANRRLCELFQYASTELVGKPVEILVPAMHRPSHPEKLQSYFADPIPRALGAGRELFGVAKSGDEIPVEIALMPLDYAGGTLAVAHIVDNRQRAETQRQLKQQALVSKEHVRELERFNALAVNRELRMVELKRQVNDLAEQLGRPAVYDLDADRSEA